MKLAPLFYVHERYNCRHGSREYFEYSIRLPVRLGRQRSCTERKLPMKPEVPEKFTEPSLSAQAMQEKVDVLKIVMIYAAFAGLWILLSDQALDLVFRDPVAIHLASTLKGWLFVGVTAIHAYLQQFVAVGVNVLLGIGIIQF